MNRVELSMEAKELLRDLKEEHGDLIFHQSGGCCDGSAPMLIKADELYIDESDVLLGVLDDVPYFMNKDQYDYWKHTYITVDITKGRGSSFSLEIPSGYRFIIHSRMMTEGELRYFKLID